LINIGSAGREFKYGRMNTPVVSTTTSRVEFDTGWVSQKRDVSQDTLSGPIAKALKIMSRVWVIIDGVWNSNWIYWIFTESNCSAVPDSDTLHVLHLFEFAVFTSRCLVIVRYLPQLPCSCPYWQATVSEITKFQTWPAYNTSAGTTWKILFPVTSRNCRTHHAENTSSR
jgi:hypothetical protein